MLKLILLALVAFIGLPTGVFLSYFTKEELPTGAKIFLPSLHVLISIIFFVFIYSMNNNIVISLATGILAAIASFILRRHTSINVFYATCYLAFGITSFFAVKESIASLFMSFVFLFGLPGGSLIGKKELDENKKKIKKLRIISFFGLFQKTARLLILCAASYLTPIICFYLTLK
ncbi:MAG: hypothetical protein V1859_00625 [archaeon]